MGKNFLFILVSWIRKGFNFMKLEYLFKLKKKFIYIYMAKHIIYIYTFE